ncbi:hypothetical protein [Litoreibacter albidus]|uniref:hypothetical protein n=1 Tax=Litoreibacter albidus TaxID=670155 RepID=UPI0037362322
MRFFFLATLGLASACAAPGISVMGGQTGVARVGEYSFTVHHKGSRAEAYRTNVMARPQAREVFAAGATAIEQVTGCRVIRSSVRGDVALIQGDLLC